MVRVARANPHGVRLDSSASVGRWIKLDNCCCADSTITIGRRTAERLRARSNVQVLAPNGRVAGIGRPAITAPRHLDRPRLAEPPGAPREWQPDACDECVQPVEPIPAVVAHSSGRGGFS